MYTDYVAGAEGDRFTEGDRFRLNLALIKYVPTQITSPEQKGIDIQKGIVLQYT